MEFAQGLVSLAERGINLFACVPVAELPEDLRAFFPERFRAHTLCLMGHGGRRMWERLSHPLRAEDPIDSFAREQVAWFAREVLGGDEVEIVFPHSEWLLPLQRIGRVLNLARPSLVGLDISADYGLWFAYRAAFLTRANLPRTLGPDFASACDSCAEKPCIRVCPAGAVRGDGFVLKSCAEFRLRQDSVCADRCLAREACPIRAEHRYSREQIRYHMALPSPRQKLRDSQ